MTNSRNDDETIVVFVYDGLELAMYLTLSGSLYSIFSECMKQLSVNSPNSYQAPFLPRNYQLTPCRIHGLFGAVIFDGIRRDRQLYTNFDFRK